MMPATHSFKLHQYNVEAGRFGVELEVVLPFLTRHQEPFSSSGHTDVGGSYLEELKGMVG